MKKIKTTFDYDGQYIVVAKGVVSDSLSVLDLYFEVKDYDDQTVLMDKNMYNDIKELAEEIIIDEFNNIELRF